MFSSLPFDYVQHVARDQRIRRSRVRPDGSRVRRITPRGAGE